ncbi:MAG: GIY-YIG nuclease family protein [Paraprevotella sp.]|nr:GIY-YIG nuclease family protein [Paraprevotella sp.]
MTNIHQYWVYIMANHNHNVIYVGVTNDLFRRYQEHKRGEGSTFTAKYKCHKLIYFEEFNNIDDAIAREKEIKGWRRSKKEILIKTMNPEKNDLGLQFV